MRPPSRSLIAGLILVALTFAPCRGACDPITPSEDWKNSVDFPLDPFRGFSTGAGSGWVKFTILACDPDTVYFQHSTRFPFHFDFVRERLDPYLGIGLNDFNAIALHATGQELILGAVIFPPIAYDLGANFPHFNEYGIQLVRQDAYSSSETIDLLETVRGAVNADPSVLPIYFPTYEQQAAAESYAPALAGAGFEVGSIARWADGSVCYAEGWSIGRLVFVEADQIDAAYLSGALRPEDILITDNIPAEIPFVAGIISTKPATPNSHVAILAGTFNVPFGFVEGDDANAAMALVGNLIVLRVGGETYNSACGVKVLDVENRLSEDMVNDLLALKATPVLEITPVAPFGAYTAPTDGLTAADIRFFGGKAANFGTLRRSIPDNSPVSMAISFDLWNEFMDQPYGGNPARTLREEIALRLSPYAWPPDFAALSAELDGIRDLIKDATATPFTPAQRGAILGSLQDPQYGFDAARKIRFRSSTNVEDAARFTGAGLYDSKSGCLMDDIDGDLAGPSHCDPTDADERGVFRAIKRVYASFYNDNAYLERLRHAINENDVGMAILVHHSFPDEIELANGVATLDVRSFSDTLNMVTQLGATSVTNPEDGSIPEEVHVAHFGGNVYPDLVRPSNLVQIGATVMAWNQDYVDLAQHMFAAAAQFELESGLVDYLLDFEYKKVANEAPPRDLVVKQIRQIPLPNDAPRLTPVLVGRPMRFEVFQGEFADPLGLHRLKSRFLIDTATLELSDENLAATFYTGIDMQYFDGCAVRELAGDMASLPGRAHTFAASTTTDSWRIDGIANPRTYTLTTGSVGLPRSLLGGPVVCLTDLGYDGADLTIAAVHDRPVPEIDFQGNISMTTVDYARLVPIEAPADGNGLQQRVMTDGTITIDARFYWSNPPLAGVVAGFTYHLNRWEQTVITGLTTEPIVLRDWYSQTYRPGHHNFSEDFVFEPRLEPSLTDLQRSELEDAGVGLIHAAMGFMTPRITILRSSCSYCACEMTGDDETDIVDLLQFMMFWFALDPRSDLDGDGIAGGILDLLAFLECWFGASAGGACP